MSSAGTTTCKGPAASRRAFLRRAAGLAALAGVAPQLAGEGVAGANERTGVGFIGAGGRGSTHMQILAEMREKLGTPVDLVAACDVYRPRLERARKAHAMPAAYMDHRELLADPAVDLVCIATPDHQHGYQVIDAVRAGKDVYCEKPVTHWRQFDLLKRMVEEVQKSGRVFQLGTQAMSDSAWHQMKALVREGIIGRPVFGETGFFRVGDWGERGMPVDDPNARPGKDLNWEAFLGDAPERPFSADRFFRWRLFEDYAGGPATDLYPHILTQVVDIVGVTLPERVVATGGIHRYDDELREVPDTCSLLAEYPEKVTISLVGTQANDHNGPERRGSGQRLPVIRGWEGTLAISGGEIVFTPVGGVDRKPARFAIEHPEHMHRHWGNLLECAREGKRRTFSPADLAYWVQTALIMASWAMRKSQVARFDGHAEKIVLGVS